MLLDASSHLMSMSMFPLWSSCNVSYGSRIKIKHAFVWREFGGLITLGVDTRLNFSKVRCLMIWISLVHFKALKTVLFSRSFCPLGHGICTAIFLCWRTMLIDELLKLFRGECCTSIGRYFTWELFYLLVRPARCPSVFVKLSCCVGYYAYR